MSIVVIASKLVLGIIVFQILVYIFVPIAAGFAKVALHYLLLGLDWIAEKVSNIWYRITGKSVRPIRHGQMTELVLHRSDYRVA